MRHMRKLGSVCFPQTLNHDGQMAHEVPHSASRPWRYPSLVTQNPLETDALVHLHRGIPFGGGFGSGTCPFFILLPGIAATGVYGMTARRRGRLQPWEYVKRAPPTVFLKTRRVCSFSVFFPVTNRCHWSLAIPPSLVLLIPIK